MVHTENGFSKLEPGDLLFFGQKATQSTAEKVSHVGLYLGDSEFIHASGKVKINSLDKNRFNYTEAYTLSFVRARRLINYVDGKGIEWIQENDFYKEILPE